MHITFKVNRIISTKVLYNDDFKNMVSRKTRLKFDNMFKATLKKFIFYLNQSTIHTNILYVLRNTEILQFVFFHVLIPHDFDLDLSALCAVLTLIVNNFNYDHNLTKIFWDFLRTLMYRFMKKKIDFLKF